ncbi:hypothetical protein CVT25_001516 [Psilocybe cyanescens]|uniref:Uncharacterized protein n=1 Tax=Psilocybe cyanescens TaxID=93625 RepID=A0A409W0B5_PSICY|nr:hypothetical protein CVT25_001516 [Psilocybe cyanescens]
MPYPIPSASRPQELCSKFCCPELVERISLWRARVLPHSSRELPSTTRPKSRHQKPYTRPFASIQSRDTYLHGRNLPEPASDALVLSAHHKNPLSLLSSHDSYNPAIAYRGSYDSELPDPVRSPLTSDNPSYLAGEYCRIMLLHDQLQIKRRQLEIACLRKVGDRDITQQLLDIGAAIQRITKSTHYIVARSRECGLNLDFNTIYAKYCDQLFSAPESKAAQEPDDNFIKMPQARAFSEAWKFSPL